MISHRVNHSATFVCAAGGEVSLDWVSRTSGGSSKGPSSKGVRRPILVSVSVPVLVRESLSVSVSVPVYEARISSDAPQRSKRYER